MKTISQILTLLVVLKVTQSSTIETMEVSTKMAEETELIAQEVTTKPSNLQPADAVINFINTKSPITCLEIEEVLIKPTSLQSESFVGDVTTKSLETTEFLQKVQTKYLDQENITSEEQLKAATINNLTLDDAKTNPIIFSKSTELQTESLSEEIGTTQTPTMEKEKISKSLTTLEDYAVKEMMFILDHILVASQEFVSKVLQATGNSKFQRDHLKRYAENLDLLLNPSDDDYSNDIEVGVQNQKQPEDPYSSVLKKLTFLKDKSTEQLQSHLPTDWIKAYKSKKQEISIWLDKTAEQMRNECNRYISDEIDHIKYQYFNEAFDDIPRASEIYQKLAILIDLIKIVKNEKQITYLDLYMQ